VIGFALAQYWNKNGVNVVLADIAQEALDTAARILDQNVATVLCDITKEEDCARLADTAIEKFGRINLVAPFVLLMLIGLASALYFRKLFSGCQTWLSIKVVETDLSGARSVTGNRCVHWGQLRLKKSYSMMFTKYLERSK